MATRTPKSPQASNLTLLCGKVADKRGDADDLACDLEWELEQLRSAGIERVVAVDLTRSDVGIPVVRVVIPGLEWDCTHPDYTPGARARRAGHGAR